jgi:hypothetical protein
MHVCNQQTQDSAVSYGNLTNSTASATLPSVSSLALFLFAVLTAGFCACVLMHAVQRLRGLAQLGCTRWVFPTAEHSRFGHCVGTAHLAVTAAAHLASTGLRVRPDDVEMLEAAGRARSMGARERGAAVTAGRLLHVSAAAEVWQQAWPCAQLCRSGMPCLQMQCIRGKPTLPWPAASHTPNLYVYGSLQR